MRLLIIGFILLLFSMTAPAQTLFLIDNNNQLHSRAANTCTTDSIVGINSFFSDISFHPNGRLYGIRGNGNLYEIDTTQGGITLIHTFENTSYNSLTTSSEGIFYTIGSSGELRSYNLATDVEVLHGVTDAQVGGDLTFIAGELYLGTLGARIALIDLETPANSQIVIDLDIPGTVIGLSAALTDCDSVVTYAVVSGLSSGLSELYRVDLAENTVELECFLPFNASGSATYYEYLESNHNRTPFTLDSIVYDIPLCTDPVSDVQFYTSHGIAELNFSLNDSLFNNDGFFNALSAGNYHLLINDVLGCQLEELVTIDCEETSNLSPHQGESEGFRIYPNPANGFFTIKATKKLNPEHIKIFSSSLHLIPFTYQWIEDQIKVDLHGAIPGIYYIQVDDYLQRVIIIK